MRKKFWPLRGGAKVSIHSFKVTLDNFFGLTLSLWSITWLNSVIVVKKWHHSLLNCSPQAHFYHIFFATRTRVSLKNALSVLSVLISRSMLHFLVTGDVGMSWLSVGALRSDSPLLTRVSAGDTISRLELKLRRTSLLFLNLTLTLSLTLRESYNKQK